MIDTGTRAKLPLSQRIDGLAFDANNGTTQVKLPKGLLLDRLTLSINYQAALGATTATAVRARGVPIRSMRVVADNGTVLKSWRPSDAIRRNELHGRKPLAAVVNPPTALTGTVTGTADIDLYFGEPYALDGLRFKTALPTWLYNEVYLVIDWGGLNEIFVQGSAAGAVSLVASGGGTGLSVTGWFWDKYSMETTDEVAFAVSQGAVYESYGETGAPAVASPRFSIDLPRTEDVRTITIVTEDANGQPVDTILNAISVEENNVNNIVSRLDARAVKHAACSVFDIATPLTGTYIIEFAPDRDIEHIEPASGLSAFKLLLDTSAVAGTIRVSTVRIAPHKVA